MSDEERIRAARERYLAAAHGMQSGVKLDHERGSSDGSPKHLRVGVNSGMVSHAALVHLLIESGVISEVEYVEKLAEAMEREHAGYEGRLGVRLG